MSHSRRRHIDITCSTLADVWFSFSQRYRLLSSLYRMVKSESCCSNFVWGLLLIIQVSTHVYIAIFSLRALGPGCRVVVVIEGRIQMSGEVEENCWITEEKGWFGGEHNCRGGQYPAPTSKPEPRYDAVEGGLRNGGRKGFGDRCIQGQTDYNAKGTPIMVPQY